MFRIKTGTGLASFLRDSKKAAEIPRPVRLAVATAGYPAVRRGFLGC